MDFWHHEPSARWKHRAAGVRASFLCYVSILTTLHWVASWVLSGRASAALPPIVKLVSKDGGYWGRGVPSLATRPYLTRTARPDSGAFYYTILYSTLLCDYTIAPDAPPRPPTFSTRGFSPPTWSLRGAFRTRSRGASSRATTAVDSTSTYASTGTYYFISIAYGYSANLLVSVSY